ncbi:RibD domain-containing protein [Geodermatophilus normandii]|uniref:RibD domain-containing protein n=1 Tax=Geodermatophilus normandii TaxID=1137989 RepID=A0A317QLJ7_9ACTN|nr:dihydrofolate reductase family protein [Geodermatophilus normandii]PWW23697.1 RibD domain-containing protein [Geodermatophilus normandii]
MRRLHPSPVGDLTDGDLTDGDLTDDDLAEAYRLPPGRSFRVDFVASLDGAVTVDGVSAGLGSPGDRRVFTTLRALADVVLVGHGTAAGEGYRPVTADSAVGRRRAELGRAPSCRSRWCRGGRRWRPATGSRRRRRCW